MRLALACLLLTGCAHGHWVSNTASDGLADRDKRECAALAYQAFPAARAPAPLPNKDYVCFGDPAFVHCSPTGMQFGELFDPESRNALQNGRLAFAQRCMNDRGWTWRQ